MMELPLNDDVSVVEELYQFFPYTRDYPLELRGSLVDDAVSLGTLKTTDFLGFLIAYPVTAQHRREGFPFLSQPDNLKLACYRHIKIVQPWPQPEVTSTTFDGAGRGVITSINKVDVLLKDIGGAQLWWGEGTGVLWEATLEADEKLETLLLNAVWERLETYLDEQGVRRIFTYAFDPAYPRDWYQRFLLKRDYQAHGDFAMVKEVGGD